MCFSKGIGATIRRSVMLLGASQGLLSQWADSALAADSRGSAGATTSFEVSITVDAAKSLGEFRPVWDFFGYDEPNFTYMRDGQKLLGELSRLGTGPVFIRTHHLLTSGPGKPALKWGSTDAYTEDANGTPTYNWKILDHIFDTILEHGLKPLVEIGFMPEALSVHPQDYPHDPPANKMVSPGLGFSYPPKDYRKWGELCYQWTRHCVERYGAVEVEKWRWEVWNEPNIFYWRASPDEYHKLYDFATDGVRRALPSARVGGPHTAGGPGGHFLHDFLVHCLSGTNYATSKIGSPLDFVAFHAKGNPKFENEHVRMGIANQLRNIDEGFAAVAAFPELKHVPIIIGESDPEGCAACQGPQLGYRNGTVYSSYTAASIAREFALADKHGVNFEGALTWAFEFEAQPYFAGFRVLASNGIDLPVLNVFRLLGKMSGKRLMVSSSAEVGLTTMLHEGVRGAPDVSGLSCGDDRRICVLLWHYHDDDVPGPAADVSLSLTNLPWGNGPVSARHYRIDAEHSNAFELWKRLGSPQNPAPEQYAQLEQAGQLALMEQRTIHAMDRKIIWRFEVPRQAVSLLVLER